MSADTIKIPNKASTLIIAHRGLSGIERQNTNAAFIAAGNRSYFGIETDIHVTADKRFAVIHDDTTGSVAYRDISVENSTYEELSKLILKSTDGVERGDLRIPTLKEYVSICKKYGKICVLEIKNKFEKEDLKAVVKEIKELDYIDGIIFISFDLSNLIFLRSLLPDAKIQYLFGKLPEGIFDTLKKYNFDADVYYDVATKDFIDKVHSLGLKVNAWTVDKVEIAEHLINFGIDYITTNILE